MTTLDNEKIDALEDSKEKLRSLQKDAEVDGVSVAASNVNSTKQIEWSPENEVIMVEWCDVAQCYKWLHSRSHEKYANRNAWYTIPAIVLSTISGTASFAQTSLPLQYQTFAPMAIGSINILVGILTTVQQYLKISELNEAHRVSSISWDKFARNIRIELAKKPEERMDAGHFLKINRQEYDRLMETSPNIKQEIITEFEKTFKGRAGTIERKRFDELKKPDICSVIITANETRHHWYLDKKPERFVDSIDSEDIRIRDETIRMQTQRLEEKESELKKKRIEEIELKRQEMETLALYEQRKKGADAEYNSAVETIHSYIDKFIELHGRDPIRDEIHDNLNDVVRNDFLARFLKERDGFV
jgi:hypothetical protein